MLGNFYYELVFQMVFYLLTASDEWGGTFHEKWKKIQRCVPQSCSVVAISIILFMTHCDDFHMGVELELHIHLLLAFHDFFRVSLSNMNIFRMSLFPIKRKHCKHWKGLFLISGIWLSANLTVDMNLCVIKDIFSKAVWTSRAITSSCRGCCVTPSMGMLQSFLLLAVRKNAAKGGVV